MDENLELYLESIESVDKNTITTLLYIDQDPLKAQKNILALKNKAISKGIMRADDFDNLYQETVDELDRRNQERIDSAFEPFEPFESENDFNLPNFPVDCLPYSLGDYCAAVSESLQVPVDMAATACFSVLSLAVQGKFCVQPKEGWTEQVNLYTLISAPPSERKSPTLQAITAPVTDFVTSSNEQLQPNIDQYRSKEKILTQAISRLEDAISKKQFSSKGAQTEQTELSTAQAELRDLRKNPVQPMRLLVDDVTPEKLADIMQRNHGKAAILSAEGGSLDIVAGRYSDRPNLDVFLKGYSGEPLMVDRKAGQAVDLKRAHLTIGLMVQPDVLERFVGNPELRGRGLAARFLYCIPKSKVGTRKYNTEPIPPEIQEQYNSLVYRLLKIPDPEEPAKIFLTGEAQSAARAFFDELEPRLADDLENISDWAGKLHGQTVRIAALLHCCNHLESAAENPLTVDTMEKAQKIGKYYLEHAMAALASTGEEGQSIQEARYILKRLDKLQSDCVTVRELHQKCKGRTGFKIAAEFRDKLEPLISRGYFMIESLSDTGGRPKELIRVNPAYREAQKRAKENRSRQ